MSAPTTAGGGGAGAGGAEGDSTVYLDNNATTPMPEGAKRFMCSWLRPVNASAGYRAAREAAALLAELRRELADYCGVPLDESERAEEGGGRDGAPPAPPPPALPPRAFRMVLTSGSSESNAAAVRGVVDAYWRANGRAAAPPHLVVSAVEHKSLLLAARALAAEGRAELAEVPPDPLGFVRPEAVAAALRAPGDPRGPTILVAVMAANNETGCVNDCAAIGALAHARRALFLCDMVQTFGKAPPDARLMDAVDLLTASFHKLHGPPGVGLLGVRAQLWHGWRLPALVPGTQQGGARGGTENLPGAAGALAGLRFVRARQRAGLGAPRLQALRERLVAGLCRLLPCVPLAEWLREGGAGAGAPPRLVLVSGLSARYLPNTLMLAVAKPAGAPFCNVRLKEALERRGVIVSVGSACNTSARGASHVVRAMGLPEVLRRGVLRVSLGLQNTEADVDAFVARFGAALREVM